MNTRLVQLRQQQGLGELTKSQWGGVSASAALMTAAAFDPEPISKGFLLVAAGISSAIASIFSGCGQTCIRATQIVNEVEPYLKRNVDEYLALPIKTVTANQAAQDVFNNAWQAVVNSCSDPQLGDAGKRCISDRQRGGKWDWFSYYLDPITRDKNLVDDTFLGQSRSAVSTVEHTVSSIFGGNLLIPALLLIGVGLFVTGGKKNA